MSDVCFLLDEHILTWIEANGCMLITNNRDSMPAHLAAHLAEGRHVRGVLQIPKRPTVDTILGEVLLIWGAGLPGEFQDQMVYPPLRR